MSGLPYGLSSRTKRLVWSNAFALEAQLEIEASIVAAETHLRDYGGTDAVGASTSRTLARHCKSAIGPIRLIPAELLAQIFVHYRDNCFDSKKIRCSIGEDTVLGFSSQEVLGISHVSAQWRSVALETPELWARFAFSCPGMARKRQALWQTWLERARNHPICFGFTCPGRHRDNRFHGDLAPTGSPCYNFLTLLVSRSDYWQEAQFTLPPASMGKLAGVHVGVPRLEALSLQMTGLPPAYPLILKNFAIAPRLRSISLRSEGLIKIELPWAQITHYRGDQWLRRDTHILSIASKISTLVLDDAEASYSFPLAPSEIVVPHLRHLRYVQGEGWGSLTRLIPPSLQSFHLHGSTAKLNRQITPLIVDLLQRAGSLLTHLHIDHFERNPHLLELFAATPALTSLTIVGANNQFDWVQGHSGTDTIFDAIREPALGKPGLLSELRRLAVTGFGTSEAFLRMVEARGNAWWQTDTARLETLVLREVDISRPESSQACLDLLKAQGMNVVLIDCRGGVHATGGDEDMDLATFFY
ncbi:hypothetical protein C8R43DRAFT_1104092 [Mycena crocata]|nr:hypothetical protein C8R43DRAFT_1104092 [Mycena crocata]